MGPAALNRRTRSLNGEGGPSRDEARTREQILKGFIGVTGTLAWGASRSDTVVGWMTTGLVIAGLDRAWAG